MFQMLRKNRRMLSRMFQGSSPLACSTRPTRIESRIRRTTTASGGPPKSRLATLFITLSLAPGRGPAGADLSGSCICGFGALMSGSSPRVKHSFEHLEPIGLAGRLVPAQPIDAGETHGDARFMPGRALQPLECDLHYEPL